MKLSVSLLADGQIIPAGAEVDPSIVPDHIKKQYELSIQPKKKVPKDHQGARYCDAQGNLITDWDEHLACAREGGLENLVQVQCRSAGLPRQRPRLMITLQRLKQVLSHYLDSDEFTWKDMHRRCKSTRRHDYARYCGEASWYVSDRRIHFLPPVA